MGSLPARFPHDPAFSILIQAPSTALGHRTGTLGPWEASGEELWDSGGGGHRLSPDRDSYLVGLDWEGAPVEHTELQGDSPAPTTLLPDRETMHTRKYLVQGHSVK